MSGAPVSPKPLSFTDRIVSITSLPGTAFP
jgi:hypothetical protein